MIELQTCRSTFGRLNFAFQDDDAPTDVDGRLIGFAPQGRVGVVEVLEHGERNTVSLLVSTSREPAAQSWTATCVATLAATLGLDFCGWLAAELRVRGTDGAWSTARQFGSATVSATFFPLDSILISVDGLAG